MKFLANIFTTESFDDNLFYNIVDDESKLIDGIPTLIIGKANAKRICPCGFRMFGDNWEQDLIKLECCGEMYWTYGKREERDRNETAIVKFKKIVLEKLLNSVNYQFFNVLTSDKEQKIELNNILTDSSKKFVLISDDMLYIFFPDRMETVGVSLRDIEYGGTDRKKILRTLYSNASVTMTKERDFMSYETREMLRKKKYVIPYLSSLSA